eukprot:m.214633 g.214633  ORF g.214633 m.214633 type:complete len:89 (+) comp15870_c0_seq7:515-781(+)
MRIRVNGKLEYFKHHPRDLLLGPKGRTKIEDTNKSTGSGSTASQTQSVKTGTSTTTKQQSKEKNSLASRMSRETGRCQLAHFQREITG